MKKVLVLYYTQTGQLKQIIESLTLPLKNSEEIEIDIAEYKPKVDYPFPWPSDQFFDAMPETVMGISCEMLPINKYYEKEYDLIIFGYQVWFLSPSIPANSFLDDPHINKLFHNKKIITVLGVRNMWIMAHKIIIEKIQNMGATLVGNIVLEDKAHNLISVVTIIRWLVQGRKGPFRLLPAAGVSKMDIDNASKFGIVIKNYLVVNKKFVLQQKLIEQGAVKINYAIMQIEKNARRIFTIWAKYILKKGQAGDKNRLKRVRLFKYYLLFMIFVISPFASIVFKIKKLILFPKVNREIQNIKMNPLI